MICLPCAALSIAFLKKDNRVPYMAYNAKKTEHTGPKKGSGAFYGRKAFAKKASNRCRREADKRAASCHGTSQM